MVWNDSQGVVILRASRRHLCSVKKPLGVDQSVDLSAERIAHIRALRPQQDMTAPRMSAMPSWFKQVTAASRWCTFCNNSCEAIERYHYGTSDNAEVALSPINGKLLHDGLAVRVVR
jgi:hypothetical protein